MLNSLNTYQDADQVIINGYTFIYELGQGQFGVVYKCEKNNQFFAAKLIDKNFIELNGYTNFMDNFKYYFQPFISFFLNFHIYGEINALQTIKSENVIKIEESFQDEEKIYIIMEYCNGGDLADYIQKQPNSCLTEEQTIKFLIQIMNGMFEVHSKNILHRDLKPENIMLKKKQNGDIKLLIGDFGMAKVLDPHKMTQTVAGTQLYMAPEVIKENEYNHKADIWSIGCIIFYMLFGEDLFKSMNPDPFYTIKKFCMPKFSLESAFKTRPQIQNRNPNISQDIQSVLEKIFVINPNKRIGFQQLYQDPI